VIKLFDVYSNQFVNFFINVKISMFYLCCWSCIYLKIEIEIHYEINYVSEFFLLLNFVQFQYIETSPLCIICFPTLVFLQKYSIEHFHSIYILHYRLLLISIWNMRCSLNYQLDSLLSSSTATTFYGV